MSAIPEDDISPYELLEVSMDATDQEIKTTYRKRSLKVHPDRNPNNPDAARKFHELNQAYELLLDPLRRLALDAKLRIKLAKKERFKAYDAKRKNLVEELEERERAFKKAKLDKRKEESDAAWQAEQIKEQGRKMREEREKKAKEQEKEQKEQPMEEDIDEPPPLDQFDTTVRLKYSLKSHPDLTTKEAIAAFLSPFGAVDVESIVFSLKTKAKKGKAKSTDSAPTHATALVPFKTIGDAHAAVCASISASAGVASKIDFKNMEIGWVNGKEPLILGWLKKMGKIASPTARSEATSRVPSPPTNPSGNSTPSFSFVQSEDVENKKTGAFSSFPDMSPPNTTSSEAPSFGGFTGLSAPGMDYESLTLMRLRQAERERLEREILEQEMAEEQTGAS